MKAAVIGTGYVGLVTAVCLAHWGHEVKCVEADGDKLARLRTGRAPILEAQVEELMLQNTGRLTYTDDCGSACADAEAVFLCVGTPEREDGSANLTYVLQAAEQLARAARHDCVCVVKSTVPVGTNDKLEQLFLQTASRNVRIEVASNPEFLSQGTAVRDFLSGPRVVCGVKSTYGETVLRTLYAQYIGQVIVTDCRSAEMIKYASNNFLALKISYINEIANLCGAIGADVDTVAYGMGLDPRIGPQFLRAGIGYGGSCFPKDTKALQKLARNYGCELKTVKASIEVNERQKLLLLKRARSYYRSLKGKTVAVLGLTFKPGTDDLRSAPSLQIIPELLRKGASVRAWDPAGCERMKAIHPYQVTYCGELEAAVAGADLCMILTEWQQIRDFSPEYYARLMRRPVVLDGRNCYSLAAAQKAGILYESVGRRRVMPDREVSLVPARRAAARGRIDASPAVL